MGCKDCLLTWESAYDGILSGRRIQNSSASNDYSFKNDLCKNECKRIYMERGTQQQKSDKGKAVGWKYLET